jgi:GDP-L-fucose synthase
MLELHDKKILVTGGTGFLGTHVVRALKDRGVLEKNIIVPARETHDLRTAEACREVTKGADVVIHLAGITGDGQFHREHPAEIFHDNLTMGVELMEAARANGVKKFVTAGSITEYPVAAPLPFREEDIWAGSVEELHEAYSVAKTMLLVQAQAYRAQYGFDAVHLLLTNMYGPGKEAVRGFVITNIIRRILEAKRDKALDITLWGTGAPTRDFIFVKDAAEAFVAAAERYDKPEPVNVGSGWEISIKELAETIARLMDWKGDIKWDISKPDGQMRRILDPGHAEREFGFRARTSFEEGLKETIAWQEKQFQQGA